MKKEKKQLRYPGLKAGSIYGTVIFFIIPLIDTLTSENPNFITSLLNTKHIFKTILGAFFFGVMMHIVDSLRIARAKRPRLGGPYEITSNFTDLSSFVQFSAYLHHHFRELNQRDIPRASLYSSP